MLNEQKNFLGARIYVPKYDKTRNRVYVMVKKIMEECEISDDIGICDINKDILDKLQNWLDTNIWIKKNFPDKRFQIRIFLKDQERAIYTTTVKNCHEPIPINLAFFPKEDNVLGCFSPIKHMSLFFKARYYCNLCSETYDRYERHAIKCPYRCNKCGRGSKEKCEIPGKL